MEDATRREDPAGWRIRPGGNCTEVGAVTVGTDMTARQIEGEFETVVDVLRAGAVVNADVEAYVEPATETSRGAV